MSESDGADRSIENDEASMRELAEGNHHAFDALVFRHHRSLFGYIYRLVLHERTAEDLVQETLMRVFQQAEEGFVPERFKPWLYRIATNVCKDHWKKASTRHERPMEWLQEPKGEVVTFADRHADRQWLVEALHTLSIPNRMALYLRFYQDLTYGEIAEVLDLPINTVKSRVSRGLKALENHLNEANDEGGWECEVRTGRA
ncbi:RNA polymerase sigma factor [Marininema halotolerans]|uniref:RNA polymerase sigma factor n=1 Tax=Marininema halotolerans TaxID=1155944 RepID=A0A1I6NU48_9BACL|nr:RNA polymerase sigma factor [Marininema halotolerans]SFS31389.1 RNA polymerase sigma-70 factor, ECF subfamily [Marininema halotolerans]